MRSERNQDRESVEARPWRAIRRRNFDRDVGKKELSLELLGGLADLALAFAVARQKQSQAVEILYSKGSPQLPYHLASVGDSP